MPTCRSPARADGSRGGPSRRRPGAPVSVVMAMLLVLGALALHAADEQPPRFAGQLMRGAVRELAAGKLLVAARHLPDPNFSETVVLLTDFGAEGAVGLIVNRRTDVTIGRLFPGAGSGHAAGGRAYFGGPVAPQGVLALLRSTGARTDSRRIVEDVYLVNTQGVLEEMLVKGVDASRFRVYLGYAGWGVGQLERETAEGAWHVLAGEAAIVFDADPDATWDRQIRRSEALSVRAPAARPPMS
jgi:putative transcriptional regulator